MLTLKYDATGHFRWAERNAGPGADSVDLTNGLVVNGAGVYVGCRP
jgi:hypothetical protein